MAQRRLKGHISVDLEGETFQVDLEDLQAELKIDRTDLGEELTRQPGMYAWIATLAAQCEYDAGRSKQVLESVKATLAKDLRAEEEGKKRGEKLTNDGVKEAVMLEPAVIDSYDMYLEDARRAAILTGFREAIRQRAQMLQAITMLTRAEMHIASE